MDNTQLSDEKLLAHIAAKDAQALRCLAKRYQQATLSLAYRYLQNWDDAEDIAQEAFIRVFQSAGHYKGQSGFKTWLYRIVVNLCMDHHRKNRPNISLDNIPAEMAAESAPDPLETSEMTNIVQKTVHQLPERQRIALLLHRYENLTHTQISEVTGWSRSAVESLLVRAYENLRKKLSKFAETSD